MNEDEYADRIRRIIQNENTLENNRLQWMLVIQGFLLTGLGASIKSDIIVNISIIFAIIGFVTSLSTFSHLIHSRMAMHKASTEFKKKFPNYQGPKVIGLDVGELKWYFRFIVPPYVLPVLFMVTWVAVPMCLKVWR